MRAEERASKWEAVEREVANLSPEGQAQGWRLVRSCDAYSLLRWVLEDAAERGDVENGADLENARAELLVREEEAEGALLAFKRVHGIPE